MHVPPVFIPFKNETIYSVISRYHAISGYFDQKVSVGKVFGTGKKRIHPYLPCNVVNYADYFSVEPKLVLRHQTLLPLFAAYLDELQRSKLQNAMLKNGSAYLASLTPHYKLRFFAGHKYCPACAKEDFEKYGTTYWHIEHQVPGISACSKHGCCLVGVCNDDAHLDRKLILPSLTVKPVTAIVKEAELADFASGRLIESSSTFCFRDPIKSLLTRLMDFGLVTTSGRLKFTTIQRYLSSYWKSLGDVRELSVPTSLLTFDYIGPMLRAKTRTPAHPIKHFLLSCWLDKEHSSNLAPTQKFQPVQWKSEKGTLDCKIVILAESGLSMNMIEKEVGVSRCYVRKVLEQNSIEHRSNSTCLPDHIVRRVIMKGVYGYAIQVIADQLSIKPSAVEHILCRTKGLCAWRKHLRQQKRLKLAIDTLYSVREDHPEWIRKDIKKHFSAEFFLLYNHDKPRLEQLLPAKTPAIPPNCKKT
jgi:hypothetical protein